MKAFVMRVAAVALAALAFPGAASADWMSGYTGNTQTGLIGSTEFSRGDGVINFAVYDNTDGSFSAFLDSAAGGGIKTVIQDNLLNKGAKGAFGTFNEFVNSQYIYFYQMVNTDPNPLGKDNGLDGLFITQLGETAYTSGGWANGYTFVDSNGNQVGLDGNRRLGPEGNDMDGAVDGTPSHSGETGVSFAANSSAQDFTKLERGDTFPNPSIQPALQWVTDLATGDFSSIAFLGSNNGPVYRQGTTSDGQHSHGDVPVPTPEPGSLALFGLALPLMGAGYVRRLRAAKAAAQA